jgi:molybdopterin adenylyltransferase
VSVRIGILTVSDRASRGEYEDLGGPAVRAYLDRVVDGPWEPVTGVVSDERTAIEDALTEMADGEGCCLVVTTGGTGPAPRDVTPEATETVCERMLPGFGEAMRSASLATVPTAILSRQVAGHRGPCLIVNLPGRPAAIAECLDAVWPAIPHCVRLLGGPDIASPQAFRPGT